jgi:NAD(P)-dependent dehydrogenase (short-subunit alcohol dehydrogenase family)
VRRLAAPDTAILIHARANQNGCEKVAAEARAKGAETAVVLGDLGDGAFAADLIDDTVDRFGSLDVLIANAGFPNLKVFGELDREGLDECYRVITAGFYHLIDRALPHLKAAQDGRVLAVSTLNAHLFRSTYPVYPASAAAKAGLEALAKSAAMQLAPYGVTVNCVAPGLTFKEIETEQFYDEDEMAPMVAQIPLGRIAHTDEIAAVIAFLAGPEASYVTGQVIHVNGGIC